jgi:hypothetical protein
MTVGCNHGLHEHRSDPPATIDRSGTLTISVRWFCTVKECGCAGMILCPADEAVMAAEQRAKREEKKAAAAAAAATPAELPAE